MPPSTTFSNKRGLDLCYNLFIIKISASHKIYISKSKTRNAGRGVFAKVAIKKGEVIESCPVIAIPEGDFAQVNESILVTYFYSFGRNKKRLVIVLGFGSLYNHSDTPSATYKEQSKERLIDFVALRDIKKDEEITVNYVQGTKKSKHPLWFDVH